MKTYYKYALVLIWMVLIFSFSSEGHSASTMHSDGVAQALYGIVHVMPSEFMVRKAAHAFLYMVLGALLFNVIKDYTLSAKRVVAYSILFALLYAITDEIHQLFIPGRTAMVSDVLIDTVASSVGVAVYYLLYKKRYIGAKSNTSV